MQFLHVKASNAKVMSSPFLVTGGSWKKSPQMTNWMPPKAASFPLILRARYSRVSNNLPSIIETRNTLVRVSLYQIAGPLTFINDQHPSYPPSLFCLNAHLPQQYTPILLPKPNARIRVDGGPFDIHRCNACTGSDEYISRSTLTKNTDDLPQTNRLARACVESSKAQERNTKKRMKRDSPAEPVKNTLYPCFTRSRTYCCSSESFMASGSAEALHSILVSIRGVASATRAPTTLSELEGPATSCERWDGASNPCRTGKIHSTACSRVMNPLYSALGYLCILKQHPQSRRASVNDQANCCKGPTICSHSSHDS